MLSAVLLPLQQPSARRSSMNRVQIFLLTTVAIIIGISIGYFMGQSSDDQTGEMLRAENGVDREPLFYRHPMSPAISSPVPARDEMGMDYIPVYADGQSDGPVGTVTIDPVTLQNIGVRTAIVERQTISSEIRAVGRIDYDEDRLAMLHPKTEGWIEEVLVSRTGDPVEENEVLVGIYAPMLVSSQQEYLLALSNHEALRDSSFEDVREGSEELVRLARERLTLLDVPEHQIRELEETREVSRILHIHSPFEGVVLTVGAREGQYITPQTELYRIADLSHVWAYADIYEYQLPWVQEGDQAEIRIAALPGRTFQGVISYIYPFVERTTRTVRLRMEFDNPDGILKPNMFADATIFPRTEVEALVIPTEAIIRSGITERAFVVREPGKFEPREIETGVRSGGLVEVISGLEAGERVVVSGQFLIDSESSIREAASKMMEPGSADVESPDHD